MRHSIVSTHRSWLRLLALTVIILTTLACGFEGGAFGSTPVPSGANRVMVPAIGSSSPLRRSARYDTGPVEAILITSPQPGQGMRGTVRIEGLSDPAIAQQLNVLVRNAQARSSPQPDR